MAVSALLLDAQRLERIGGNYSAQIDKLLHLSPELLQDAVARRALLATMGGSSEGLLRNNTPISVVAAHALSIALKTSKQWDNEIIVAFVVDVTGPAQWSRHQNSAGLSGRSINALRAAKVGRMPPALVRSSDLPHPPGRVCREPAPRTVVVGLDTILPIDEPFACPPGVDGEEAKCKRELRASVTNILTHRLSSLHAAFVDSAKAASASQERPETIGQTSLERVILSRQADSSRTDAAACLQRVMTTLRDCISWPEIRALIYTKIQPFLALDTLLGLSGSVMLGASSHGASGAVSASQLVSGLGNVKEAAAVAHQAPLHAQARALLVDAALVEASLATMHVSPATLPHGLVASFVPGQGEQEGLQNEEMVNEDLEAVGDAKAACAHTVRDMLEWRPRPGAAPAVLTAISIMAGTDADLRRTALSSALHMMIGAGDAPDPLPGSMPIPLTSTEDIVQASTSVATWGGGAGGNTGLKVFGAAPALAKARLSQAAGSKSQSDAHKSWGYVYGCLLLRALLAPPLYACGSSSSGRDGDEVQAECPSSLVATLLRPSLARAVGALPAATISLKPEAMPLPPAPAKSVPKPALLGQGKKSAPENVLVEASEVEGVHAGRGVAQDQIEPQGGSPAGSSLQGGLITSLSPFFGRHVMPSPLTSDCSLHLPGPGPGTLDVISSSCLTSRLSSTALAQTWRDAVHARVHPITLLAHIVTALNLPLAQSASQTSSGIRGGGNEFSGTVLQESSSGGGMLAYIAGAPERESHSHGHGHRSAPSILDDAVALPLRGSAGGCMTGAALAHASTSQYARPIASHVPMELIRDPWLQERLREQIANRQWLQALSQPLEDSEPSLTQPISSVSAASRASAHSHAFVMPESRARVLIRQVHDSPLKSKQPSTDGVEQHSPTGCALEPPSLPLCSAAIGLDLQVLCTDLLDKADVDLTTGQPTWAEFDPLPLSHVHDATADEEAAGVGMENACSRLDVRRRFLLSVSDASFHGRVHALRGVAAVAGFVRQLLDLASTDEMTQKLLLVARKTEAAAAAAAVCTPMPNQPAPFAYRIPTGTGTGTGHTIMPALTKSPLEQGARAPTIDSATPSSAHAHTPAPVPATVNRPVGLSGGHMMGAPNGLKVGGLGSGGLGLKRPATAMLGRPLLPIGMAQIARLPVGSIEDSHASPSEGGRDMHGERGEERGDGDGEGEGSKRTRLGSELGSGTAGCGTEGPPLVYATSRKDSSDSDEEEDDSGSESGMFLTSLMPDLSEKVANMARARGHVVDSYRTSCSGTSVNIRTTGAADAQALRLPRGTENITLLGPESSLLQSNGMMLTRGMQLLFGTCNSAQRLAAELAAATSARALLTRVLDCAVAPLRTRDRPLLLAAARVMGRDPMDWEFDAYARETDSEGLVAASCGSSSASHTTSIPGMVGNPCMPLGVEPPTPASVPRAFLVPYDLIEARELSGDFLGRLSVMSSDKDKDTEDGHDSSTAKGGMTAVVTMSDADAHADIGRADGKPKSKRKRASAAESGLEECFLRIKVPGSIAHTPMLADGNAMTRDPPARVGEEIREEYHAEEAKAEDEEGGEEEEEEEGEEIYHSFAMDAESEGDEDGEEGTGGDRGASIDGNDCVEMVHEVKMAEATALPLSAPRAHSRAGPGSGLDQLQVSASVAKQTARTHKRSQDSSFGESAKDPKVEEDGAGQTKSKRKNLRTEEQRVEHKKKMASWKSARAVRQVRAAAYFSWLREAALCKRWWRAARTPYVRFLRLRALAPQSVPAPVTGRGGKEDEKTSALEVEAAARGLGVAHAVDVSGSVSICAAPVLSMATGVMKAAPYSSSIPMLGVGWRLLPRPVLAGSEGRAWRKHKHRPVPEQEGDADLDGHGVVPSGSLSKLSLQIKPGVVSDMNTEHALHWRLPFPHPTRPVPFNGVPLPQLTLMALLKGIRESVLDAVEVALPLPAPVCVPA